MGTLTDTLSTGQLGEKPPTHSPSGSAGWTAQVLVPQELHGSPGHSCPAATLCANRLGLGVSTSLAHPGSPAKQE